MHLRLTSKVLVQVLTFIRYIRYSFRSPPQSQVLDIMKTQDDHYVMTGETGSYR